MPLVLRLACCAAAMLLALAAPGAAEACPCVRQGPACQEFWTADAVFVGRVDSIVQVAASGHDVDAVSRLSVTFSVLEPFRGVHERSVTVRTGSAADPCGYPFRVGRQYLVYASAADGGRLLTTGRCARTRPMERAGSDLDYVRGLGNGSGVPSRATSAISGTIVLRTRDLVRRRDRDHAMPGIVVSLISGDITTRVTSDRAGGFAVRDLPPGRYDARVDLPSGFDGSILPSSFELRDARACVELSAIMKSVAVVAGRVVDARGMPLPGLTVDLTVPAGLDSIAGPERVRALTRLDGTFELKSVPAGRFVVGVNTAPGSRPLLIYPGVELLRDASLVTVRPGLDVRLDDFVVPERFLFSQISGIVLDSTGRPAEGARVFLGGPNPGDHILGEPAITDLFGQFVLTVASGQEYRVFAERARSGSLSRLDVTEAVRVAITGTDRAFQRLTLRPLH